MPVNPEPDVTQLLELVQAGDVHASDRLYSIVYDELHTIAARHMRGQQVGHTLQATALVNEAFMKLVRRSERPLRGKGHLLALASRAMRTILVDHSRRKSREKRRPDGERVALEDVVLRYEERSVDLLALDEALVHLARRDERMVRLVEMRFFGGQTMEECAEALGLSLRAAERDWATARAWLRRQVEVD